MRVSAGWRVAGAVLLCAAMATAQQSASSATPAAPAADELPSAPAPQFDAQPGVSFPALNPVIPPPPTVHDRFLNWAHSTYQPGLLIPVLADTAYSHCTSKSGEYDNDAEGFGRRLGASTAMTEFHLFLEKFALNTVFHQDSSFHGLNVGTTRERAAYAVTRVVVARGDDGRPMFNYSKVIAAFASSAMANAFQRDERRSAGNTLGRAATGLASSAGMNLVREFWPEIRGLVRRHAPDRVRQMSDKLEAPVQKVRDEVRKPR